MKMLVPAVALLGGVLLLVSALILPGGPSPLTVALWSGLCAMWLFSLFSSVPFDPFSLRSIFIAYYGLQFVVWSGVVLITGLTRWNIEVGENFNTALIMAIFGLGAFTLGSRTSAAVKLVGTWVPSLQFRLSPRRTQIAILCCLILGFAAFFELMREIGGIAAYVADMETYRAGGLLGKGYLVKLATFVTSLAPLLMYARATTWKKRAIALGVLFLALLPAAVIGFRTAILFPVLHLLIIRHYLHKRMTFRAALPFLVPLMLSLALFGMWRDSSTQALGDDMSYDAGGTLSNAMFKLLSRSHGIEIVAIVNEEMDRRNLPYAFGMDSFIEIVTVVIPRTWYDGKIEDSSFRFARTFFSNRILHGSLSGVSPTLISEFYWNFGWAGIFAGMWLAGVLCEAGYKWMMASRSPATLMIYSMMASYAFMFVEAPTVATDIYWPNALLLILLLWTIKVRAPRTRGESRVALPGQRGQEIAPA